MKNKIDIVEVLDTLSGFTMTLEGVTAIMDTIAQNKNDGDYIYSRMRFVLLENVLFDLIQNMDKLYEEIEKHK